MNNFSVKKYLSRSKLSMSFKKNNSNRLTTSQLSASIPIGWWADHLHFAVYHINIIFSKKKNKVYQSLKKTE